MVSSDYKYIIEGAGSLVDMYPECKASDVNVSSHYIDEATAMRKDWHNIGRDFWKAITRGVVSEKKTIFGNKKHRKLISEPIINSYINYNDHKKNTKKAFIVSTNKEGITIKIVFEGGKK